MDDALPRTHRLRLLIADRRPSAASGLASAVAAAADLVVEETCHEAGELLALLHRRSGIEGVVIDTEMFEGDASRAVEAVRGVDPAAVLVLMTRLDEPLFKALAHERVSCISAYSEMPAIVSAIRALLSGQILLPPDVQSALMDVLRKPSAPQSLWLTSREEQVLELAATGLTISQIATSLHISHSTAKSHLLRIYEKLEAPNRSAAVANAVARGILRLSTETDERIKTAPSQTFDGLNPVDALAKL